MQRIPGKFEADDVISMLHQGRVTTMCHQTGDIYDLSTSNHYFERDLLGQQDQRVFMERP